MDLEATLSRANTELKLAEVELQAVQQRVGELHTIQQGVRLAMQRYNGTDPAPASAGQETEVTNDARETDDARERALDTLGVYVPPSEQ